ncbi:hypothetical protein LZ198_18925 [Myxococcus sp. K15C18031901]|uniref:hypothetical protein n=1 Tax=Myxococcus dinghuensis TaxID=2906761 RepID=UPI0020A75923|nr:hypothetical protein [Myxococcus dinghuensis]MCP3100950.1 hypothetical protein [Myxococcus dinghuensis]
MFWRKFRVTLDGEELGVVDGGAARLKQGVEFRLSDGSALNIQLRQTLSNVYLHVTRDGVPLPGSSTDPEQRIKVAAHLLYFLAALNTMMGCMPVFTADDVWEGIGVGMASGLFGLVVAVLGYFTFQGARAAPILAITLYVLDSLVTFGDAMADGKTPKIYGMLFRIYILVVFFQAVQAAFELHRRGSAEARVSLQP